MRDAWIVAGLRTPIGKLLGSLASLPAPLLAAAVIKKLCPGIFDRIDEVILGEVLQAGVGQAPARQAALEAGIPDRVPALTVNMVCGSGLRSVMLASQAIQLGHSRLMIAGGMESMSRAPHLARGSRIGTKFGPFTMDDHMILDGLLCAREHREMGSIADETAERCSISRVEQDQFAAESHQKALSAIGSGIFHSEIVPVTLADGKIVSTDEGPRPDSTPERLGKLKPAFSSTGSVTAGNASMISDGAAALLVADEEYSRNIESSFRVRVVAFASSGGPPRNIFLAPIEAVNKTLQLAGWSTDQVDLFEINEAFACQAIACARELSIPMAKLNVNGGAIALGHPVGASGARVLVTLLWELKRRMLNRGIVALCLGGGNAVAMAVEMGHD